MRLRWKFKGKIETALKCEKENFVDGKKILKNYRTKNSREEKFEAFHVHDSHFHPQFFTFCLLFLPHWSVNEIFNKSQAKMIKNCCFRLIKFNIFYNLVDFLSPFHQHQTYLINNIAVDLKLTPWSASDCTKLNREIKILSCSSIWPQTQQKFFKLCFIKIRHVNQFHMHVAVNEETTSTSNALQAPLNSLHLQSVQFQSLQS